MENSIKLKEKENEIATPFGEKNPNIINRKKYEKTEDDDFEIFKYQIEQLKNAVIKYHRDWVVICSGSEGSGKSTFALQLAQLLDPEFDVNKQVVFYIQELAELLKEYKQNGIKHKAIIIDEAVELFFSRESANKANKLLTKLFIANRSLEHFYIFNIPDPFYLEVYIREFRAKTLLYAFQDITDLDTRWMAVYWTEKLTNIMMDDIARKIIRLPSKFIDRYKPDLIFRFYKVEGEIWETYSRKKEEFQEKLLDEVVKKLNEEKDKDKKKVEKEEEEDEEEEEELEYLEDNL